MDIRVFAIRNRIEDQQVQLKYISTLEMAADIATKGLDQDKFTFFRDLLNGYALVRANQPNNNRRRKLGSFGSGNRIWQRGPAAGSRRWIRHL